MSAYYFVCIGFLLAVGMVFLNWEEKYVAGAFLGLAIFFYAALLPWDTVAWLDRTHRGFHLWYAPRMMLVQGAWVFASACLGLAAGLGVALRGGAKAEDPKDWEAPEESARVDEALRSRVLELPRRGETLLGVTDAGRAVTLTEREREGHMQVVGPTRSGKSQFLLALAAQDMKARLPVLLMEAKGDRSDFDQFLKAAALARRVESVRYFNPQDSRSMTFNPIRPVAGQDSTAVANQIARAIGREPSSTGEGQDYYRGVDYAKIQTMAEVFFSTGRAFTLRDCYDYFAYPEARDRALSLCPDRRLRDLARAEFTVTPDSSGLTSALRPWTTGALGELLNTYAPQIRLEDVFERRQLAYFAVPVGHLQVLANPLGRMIISGLLSVAASRQKVDPKPGPATVILDEFAEFATPVFASFVATVGSAKLRTILSHQDLGQLKRVQGMDKEAFDSVVFNNTSGCKVCFRTPDPEDAEFWAATLGTHTTTSDTERVEGGLFGDRRTGDRSRRSVEQFKIHPNRLKTLQPGTALVLAPGRATALVRTARVRGLLDKSAVPALPLPPAEEGLELRLAVPLYAQEEEMKDASLTVPRAEVKA